MTKRDGLVSDMSDTEYFTGGTELSSTGAKAIVRCPAEFHWQQVHPVQKDIFDEGALAHRLILGAGDDVHVVDAYDWRTKAAQQAKKDERSAGHRVVHRGDLLAASKMARTVRSTPEAQRLLSRPGKAEMSMFATDPDTGIRVRGRMDWLTTEDDGTPCIVDVKTTATNTHPDALTRQIASFGYHQQAAFYTDLLALCGQPGATFYFIFVPHIGAHKPRVVRLEPEAIERGRDLNRQAIETFIACTKANEWPCNHEQLITLGIPAWAYYDEDDDQEMVI